MATQEQIDAMAKQVDDGYLEQLLIEDLMEFIYEDGIWVCQVCGKQYKLFTVNREFGEHLVEKHIREKHQDIIEKLKPGKKLQVIKERTEQEERWAEEDRLEAYRKAHHQCPCEKVIEGVKFTGFLGVLGLGMFITLADEGLKRGFDWIEKQIKEDKK